MQCWSMERPSEPHDLRLIHRAEDDAIRQFLDSQDHRYDEGHSLDARNYSPALIGHPSRRGRLFLAAAAVLALELVAFDLGEPVGWLELAFCLAMLVLLVASGRKLMRRGPNQWKP